MKSYFEKLRDPRWQRKRLEIMRRANFACETCESTEKTLNVHHKLYRKGADPWEYADQELACLCKDCHGIHHEHRDAINELFGEMELFQIPFAHALLVGYMGGVVEGDARDVTHTLFEAEYTRHTHRLGMLVDSLADVPIAAMADLEYALAYLGPDGLAQAIKRMAREAWESLQKPKGGNS